VPENWPAQDPDLFHAPILSDRCDQATFIERISRKIPGVLEPEAAESKKAAQ
jgi:hypothetical protein